MIKMKTKFLIGLLITGIVLIGGCIQVGPPAMVKIVNAKLEAGSLVLSLDANQSLENVRVDLVDEQGQVLCTKYKDLVAGITEFELRDCEIRKRMTVSVSPPGGIMTTRNFQFELPSVRIKDAKFERGNIIITVDADEAIDNVRLDIVDESDTILCTKYKDLVKGLTEIELTDCEIRERITVSVSPPKAEMITKDFTLTLPEVRIKGVKSELGKLVLSLEANMDMSNVRIHVFGKDGEVLCTKSENFTTGLSELELSGCPIQNEITVSISPPTGKTTTRDFTLELPLLELKPGLRYRYALGVTTGEGYLDIYATKETDKEWEGIIGTKVEEQYEEKKARLIRFKIEKESLSSRFTYPLGLDEILEENVQYLTLEELGGSSATGVMMLPFIMLVWKAAGNVDLDELLEKGFTVAKDGSPANVSLGEPIMRKNFLAYEVTFSYEQQSPTPPGGPPPETGVVETKFFISVAKPYLLIDVSGPNMPGYSLEKVDEKTFDLSDYDGYKVEVIEIRLLQSFCEPDGIASVTIKNIGSKPIYTADIAVVQVKPSEASVSATWDKEVIQSDETASFEDQCEVSDEGGCAYQITSPRGTVIHAGMYCPIPRPTPPPPVD